MHRVRIEFTGVDQMLDFRNRHLRRGRHHRIEVAGRLAIHQVSHACRPSTPSRRRSRPSARVPSHKCGRQTRVSPCLPRPAFPTPVGVKNAGMPAPPARMRSEKVPCGTSCTSTFPQHLSRTSCFRRHKFRCAPGICPAASRRPMPESHPRVVADGGEVFRAVAHQSRIRFSGMPAQPNPPSMMVAPSEMSWMASSALETTLFMAQRF